jgi:23S rRNA (uracil1939-C5)-methyltransferase
MPSEAQDRATPPCPHFGPCGGCQLQDLTYAAQLARKAEQLRALLVPLNLVLPALQVHPSPPFGYRNCIRLTLGVVDGQLRAGYLGISAPPEIQGATSRLGLGERSRLADVGSSETAFLPITQCPIAAPILWRAAEDFLAVIHQHPAWLSKAQQSLDQLELFANAEETEVQFTLYLRTQAKTAPTTLASAFAALCEAVRARLPELTGAGIALLPLASVARSRRSEIARPGVSWGAPGLNYTVPFAQRTTDNEQRTTYWVPRTAFFQVNRFLIPELLALIASSASAIPTAQRNLAWDLYAGVGLFSRALARTFSRVTAVEIAEPAATALASPQKKPALYNLQAVKATTLDFLRAAVIQRDRPELIVLDPPRSGAGPDVCGLLARIAAPRLVYVSCSPQTLPADLATLTASGYTVSEIHLIDLFPQTTHIETVVMFTR